MESKNPVFNAKTLSKIQATEGTDVMTVHGSIHKVGLLLSLTVASSLVAWNLAENSMGFIVALISIVANLVLCFVIVRNKDKSSVLAPAYAVVEGMSLGFITYWVEKQSHGVAVNALITTFSIVGVMIVLYQKRILQATERFRKIVLVSMIGICVTYLIDLGLMIAGRPMAMIHEGGVYGILFSLLVVGIASMNLILDFDMIEKAVEGRAPKWMEWYAGFAVLVSIVWLYLEVLRLLGKARD